MKKDMNSAKKILKWKHVFMKAVVKLGNLNIPSHIIYLEKKQISHFGTKNAMEKFEKSSVCKCKCECDAIDAITWTEALKVDGADLEKTGGSVFDQEKIRHLGTSNFISSLQKMKKLDAPLSVTNYNEVTNYLSYLIRLEAQERGVQVGRCIAGREEMRPTHCWIEEDFPWSQFRTSFGHIKSVEYPGPGKLVDFFRRCVKKGLEARGIDPEKHYVDEFTDEELRKRRKLRITKGWLVDQTKDIEGEPEKKRHKMDLDDNRKLFFENVDDSIDSIGHDTLVNIKNEHIEQDSLIPLSPVENRSGDGHFTSNEMVENATDIDFEGGDLAEITSGINLEPIFPNKKELHAKSEENHDDPRYKIKAKIDKQSSQSSDQTNYELESRFNDKKYTQLKSYINGDSRLASRFISEPFTQLIDDENYDSKLQSRFVDKRHLDGYTRPNDSENRDSRFDFDLFRQSGKQKIESRLQSRFHNKQLSQLSYHGNQKNYELLSRFSDNQPSQQSDQENYELQDGDSRLKSRFISIRPKQLSEHGNYDSKLESRFFDKQILQPNNSKDMHQDSELDFEPRHNNQLPVKQNDKNNRDSRIDNQQYIQSNSNKNFNSTFDFESRFANKLTAKQTNQEMCDSKFIFESRCTNKKYSQSTSPEMYDPRLDFESRFISRLPPKPTYQENRESTFDFESRGKNKAVKETYQENANSESKSVHLINEDNHTSKFNRFNLHPRNSSEETTQKTAQEISYLNLQSRLDSKQSTSTTDQEHQDSGIDDISEFLTSISLPELVDLFVSEDVSMEMLSDMSGEDLKEIGVSKFGQRFKILKSIKSKA